MSGNNCAGLGSLSINYSKKGYRLPTEAEWEYACRGGTSTSFFLGENIDDYSVGQYAWNWANAGGRVTHLVATKAPNQYGLYDMNGNVWEWCNDWFDTYTEASQTDPTGPVLQPLNAIHVYRGGSFYDGWLIFRSGWRTSRLVGDDPPAIGFRVVIPAR